jgi:phosphoglycerol transferase MdoB-like AlkP superfamily enzyme
MLAGARPRAAPAAQAVGWPKEAFANIMTSPQPQFRNGAGEGFLPVAFALVIYALVALTLCSVMVGWCDPAFAHDGAIATSIGSIVANAIPASALALLVLGLSRRPLLSLWTSLLVLGALYVANALKLNVLDTPLLPVDFVLLAHLGDGGTLLARYLPHEAKILLALGLAGVVLLLWREPAWTRLRGAVRGLLVLVVLTSFATLAMNVRPWSAVYAADDADFLTWSPTLSAGKSGLTVTLLRYARSTMVALPTPDGEAARQLVERHASASPAPPPPATPDDLPDIVVLQSESFFDPARLRGLEADQVLPQYRRLAASARHGDLWVPTYGGGTIRTEFEVLTGIAMRYFPTVQYPYFRLTSGSPASLASVLAGRGYRTIAVHPHSRAFWNRVAAFGDLGFQQFDGIEQFGDAKLIGYYVSDDALVDHILKRLDDASGPTFVFAISMENHGPYEDYPNADAQRRAAEPVPPALGNAAARTLRGYLYHLENADYALGRLADALRARPRRTLLLFYGDHLPALPGVYAQAGFDDAAQPWDEPVPWLLLDTAGARTAPPLDTAAFYLPALLLDLAGIDDGGYFRLLEAVRRDDRPSRGWTPAEDGGLRAIMQLRQRGKFEGTMAGPAQTADTRAG